MTIRYYIESCPEDGLFDDVDELMDSYDDEMIITIRKITKEETLYCLNLSGVTHVFTDYVEAEKVLNAEQENAEEEVRW